MKLVTHKSMRYRRISKVFVRNIHAFAGEIWRPGSGHGQFTDSDSGKDTFNISKNSVVPDHWQSINVTVGYSILNSWVWG